MVDSRTRLKQTVLGSIEGKAICLPLCYEEISPEVLQAAEEVIDFYTPEDFKRVLVFALKAFEDRNEQLLLRLFFDRFFGALNKEYRRSEHVSPGFPSYSAAYHPGHHSIHLSAMSPHELKWAREWIKTILSITDWPLLENYREDLMMTYRLLSMAVDIPEKEV